MIEFISLKGQYDELGTEIETAVTRVLRSGSYVLGEEVAAIESEIAAFIGVPYAVGLASGTDALVTALRALGFGPGDEVITTPFTFIATAGAILQAGARPVFVDIDPWTLNIDPDLIEDAISPRTRAVIPVHIFGLPADMTGIVEVAERHGLHVIEDACQAIGASTKGNKVGSLGNATAISFYPTKNLGGVGDGGMLLTSNEKLAEKARLLRSHGMPVKYRGVIPGYNSRLDEIQAAVLRVKLPYLKGWNEKRREVASWYRAGLPADCLQRVPKGAEHVYHLFTIRCIVRERVESALTNAGLPSGVYYPVPLHLQPPFAASEPPVLPNSEKACNEVLSLPMHPYMSEEEVVRIVEVVKEAL